MPCRTTWYFRVQRTGLWLWALGCGGAREGSGGLVAGQRFVAGQMRILFAAISRMSIISYSRSIWCTLCSRLSTLLSTTFFCNSGSSWSSRPTLFDEEIAGWHRWINGTGVAGKGQQDAQKQSVPCSAGESFMVFFESAIHFRSCQISFCLKMFAATWMFARSWCPAINVLFRGGG